MYNFIANVFHTIAEASSLILDLHWQFFADFFYVFWQQLWMDDLLKFDLYEIIECLRSIPHNKTCHKCLESIE